MMILILQWDIASGKREAAKDWCHRNAAYRKKQPEVEDTLVMMPLHGPVYRISVVSKLSSLTAWDEFKKHHDADPEFKAILKEQQDNEYFVPGSLKRILYEVV